MARIEKTVFISYRRKDISWALAVYQYLTRQKFDVFFDYTSIPSGDFEQIIISNIKARAHFVLILTPTALDRCSEPGDWLRREIEIAIDEKRNIIPLFFDGFNFGSPAVAEKITGKLSTVNRYNGLDVPSGYFLEAMERMRGRYLNVPLSAVLHPISPEVRKVVKEEQLAANKALSAREQAEVRLVPPHSEQQDEKQSLQGEIGTKSTAQEKKSVDQKVVKKTPHPVAWGTISVSQRKMPVVYITGIFVLLIALSLGMNYLIKNVFAPETPTSIPTSLSTVSPTRVVPTITKVQSPTATVQALSIGSTMVSPKDKMELDYVPAGNFIMGSNSGENDEKPVRSVYLDAFWIDETEVTNKLFSAFVLATRYKTDAEKTGSSYAFAGPFWGQVSGVDWQHPSALDSNISGKDNHPVVQVSWNDAAAYCEWAGRRLPTEAEWEKAARGPNGNTYPWGNNSPSGNLLNSDKRVGDTTAVGKYLAGKSPYGVYDMAGNVWEWVDDWYGENYYQISPLSNPLGPATGQYRSARGSTWYFDDSTARSSDRGWYDVSYANFYLGFRCAMSASE